MSQAGIINVIESNPSIPIFFEADTGVAVALFNTIEILGAGGIVTSASGNTIIIDGAGVTDVLTLTGNTGGPLSPTANNWNIFGGSVVAGTTPVQVNGAVSTLTVNVQRTQAIGATNATNVGLAAFDSAAFDVDANGFVQLNGGGIAATSFDVQANTVPGTDPVVPSATGSVVVNGAVVANHSVVLETRSRAANAYNVEVQYATSAAATDGTKSGVAHFDSASFSVDASGFVTLMGGGLAIDSIAVQTGTSPITPTVGGLVTINGAVVAAGTNPVRSNGTGANTMAIEVQTSQALAAADATKIGLSNFDSAIFSVTAAGFVSIAGGTFVQSIVGGPGITITGTAAVPIINSVVYTAQAGTTSVISNSGSFATAAITLTLPAAPAQGDLCEFVATSAAVLVVDAPGTQLIRSANAISSAGGTISSSGLAGDSLTLRYKTSDTTWYATSIIGVWVTA